MASDSSYCRRFICALRLRRKLDHAPTSDVRGFDERPPVSSAPHEGTDILKQPAFAETPAAKSGAYIKMDGLYLLGFGPRTPQAARELAAQLYPDLELASSQ